MISMPTINDQCFYCNKNAEYSQVVSSDGTYIVGYVCKEHLVFGSSS